VDQEEGTVLMNILVQKCRDTAAARRLFRHLLTTRTVARVVVTDKLRSYGVAHRGVMPSVEHRSHRTDVATPTRKSGGTSGDGAGSA
jgi:putative transposase